ncbi:hypothetical protein EYF80_065772 [Liparis tanakae]|uniref:Uncharacterized protein n=1 Tax=Liparis tanakae TaxID=230148 RepID=A0A4Z2E5Q4_9TELE|nr:hypothetical protein EYF80_065772 [Liparis tanakae]
MVRPGPAPDRQVMKRRRRRRRRSRRCSGLTCCCSLCVHRLAATHSTHWPCPAAGG